MRKAVDALGANLLAAESDLFVFSDAARSNADVSDVEKVRRLAKEIDGFRSVSIIERSENLGLAESISKGIGYLTTKFNRVIVLEDDLITSRHFLEYMNAALDRYESEARVMQIAGHMFSADLESNYDALFLPFISSWGWATWRRAWQHYDPTAAGYRILCNDSKLRDKFDLGGAYQYFRMLQAQQEGKINSWAVRWYLSVFMHDGLALYPRRTLVQNLGFDGSGVNCAARDFIQDSIDPGFRVVRMPESIAISSQIGAVLKAIPVPKLRVRSIVNRLIRLIGMRS
jgi:hypothetical protein